MKRGFYYAIIPSLIILAAVVTMVARHAVSFNNAHEEKVVALGDSLTYGYGDKSGHGYVANLQSLFNKHYHGKVTVRNFGIPGQQSDGLLQQLNKPSVTKELDDADYIIVFIGTNDLIKSNGGDLAPLNLKEIKMGEADYVKNLKRILKILREENRQAPILFLGLYNPYPASDSIESVVQKWNDKSKKLVNQYPRVTFIATNGLFKEKSQKYFSDSLHPNKRGYDLITKRILEEYNF
ncbi:lysophospholipase L1-like esterase [Scopulibacillus darangshiensis]|uniref:Lysophospholipase L1-like esterase n=1 Tax=Scopulibacillus darangshiensis TaxID=442528 RepID=A0A4V2SKD3_9BACL|nr:GDSL-type esterase/lipase family protein [Scopulibacillus darangshiensis]TCP18626.1 lysophospholipase L1-like esterase [Scopulibacillus darangshiensis]